MWEPWLTGYGVQEWDMRRLTVQGYNKLAKAQADASKQQTGGSRSGR